MNKDLENLLDNLEPYIDKKCLEIKNKRRKRITYLFITIIIICTPSICFLLNIKLIYCVLLLIIIGSVRLFVKLPDLLKIDVKENCYE